MRQSDPASDGFDSSGGAGSAPPLALATRRMVASDLAAVMEVERLAFRHPWSSDLFARELLHDWSVILLATPPSAAGGEPDPEWPSAGAASSATGGRWTNPPASSPTGHPPVYGFVIYWLVHDEVHILNIATHPLFRGRGIARTLMEIAIAHGRSRAAKIATLEVRRSNFAAINLYRDLGFRHIGIRPNYYPEEQEDALVMNLAL